MKKIIGFSFFITLCGLSGLNLNFDDSSARNFGLKDLSLVATACGEDDPDPYQFNPENNMDWLVPGTAQEAAHCFQIIGDKANFLGYKKDWPEKDADGWPTGARLEDICDGQWQACNGWF